MPNFPKLKKKKEKDFKESINIRSYVFIFILGFSILLVSASLGTFEQNSNVPIRVLSNCSSVNLTEVNGISINQQMSYLGGQTFFYNYSNTSDVGLYTYSWSPSCETCGEVNCGNSFNITPFGEELNMSSAFVQIFLLFLFFSLIVGFYIIKKQVNLEKWHTSIIRKYESKNTAKVVLSSIGYVLVKDSFLIYYLIAFPIVTIILNLVESFSVGALSTITNLVLIGYGLGLLIVGIIFFGKLQEYIMEILEIIKNMEWGI